MYIGPFSERQITCRGLVQAYVNRAKAYNGVAHQLVTQDGAPIPPAPGVVRAGAPLKFPTATVKASTVLPDLDQYTRSADRVRPHGADGVRSRACSSSSG